MPLVVETGEPQEFINWFYRLIIFMAIGGLSGYFVEKYKKIIKENDVLYLHQPDTGIENINYLISLDDEHIQGQVVIATVLINNKNRISEVLGTDLYIQAMKAMHDYIDNRLPDQSVVIQVDSDKFWIVFKLENLDSDGKKIVEGLTNQIEIEQVKIYVDYSIGVSETKKFKDCKTLIPFRDTDRLAGYAKANNLPYVIFDNDLLTRKYEFNLLGLFPNALKEDQTFLMYQPVIDAQSNKLIGLEALIRWNSPDYGLIMPNDFIPLVESTQLIHPMTEWVIRKTIQTQNLLYEKGFKFYISINLSIKNIKNPGFFDRVIKIIEEEKAHTDLLIFEITETVLLEEKKHSKKTIQSIKDAGIKIAIDDFGKGYSSLTYLSQFRTDFLKIDRHFVSHIVDKESIKQIIQATVKLAHQFNLKVVAEGVETLEMFEEAKKLGIDYIQGFYIARPMNEDQILDWYKNFIKESKV
ncbi:EAL domain-containing protein [Hujiaoplasma nucleasis]|uniref:EAL domain-containing protein n=1 Tax=Hujiaoplasma nucleasis TaxID=2725268 RepID=A0A7L6N3T3_9MOLU|nr:EAL domain-containing protein [Hujiaoplasma nucleasis]QLY39897.1 EAL domain-containing protein [Hujiaoplasma nucleasis]